jgi:Tfp pilus assembly protein PilF
MSSHLVAASLTLFLFSTLFTHAAVAQMRPGSQRDPTMNDTNDPSGDDRGFGLGHITGSVRTYDGHPVANAVIEARDIDRGSVLQTARSGTSGFFTLNNLPSGSYDVTVTAGIEQAHEQIRISGTLGDPSVDFRLSNDLAAGPANRNAPSVSISQISVPAKARSLFDKATQLADHGKPEQALEKLNAALAISPRFAEALTLRGILRERVGKPDEALADYQQSIQDDANYPLAYLAMASLLNSAGRYAESMPILHQVERLAPNAWQTFFELARAYLGKQNFQAALLNVNHASELQGGPAKEMPELHLVRGYALLGLSEEARARQEIQIFLARQPNSRTADAARQILKQLQEQPAVSASR